MNETNFLKRWNSEKPFYEAWGHHVTNKIQESLVDEISPQQIDSFLKLTPKSRVKEESSLLAKAFHRPEKSYADPYLQIEDKVGTRFVVLIVSEIKIISKIIENYPDWIASKDRDFLDDQQKKPEIFAYQSVHYVVKASTDIQCGECTVPAGTPCEVQIRTLLQHAHSELTHDTIYKPRATATPRAKRYCARSMALIEATDDLFVEVFKEIKLASEPLEKAMEMLTTAYREKVQRDPAPSRLDTLILDAFNEDLTDRLGGRLEQFLSSKPFICTCIARRATDNLLFRQPSVLLVYLLADTGPQKTRSQWPLTPDELRPIYKDLGKSFDD